MVLSNVYYSQHARLAQRVISVTEPSRMTHFAHMVYRILHLANLATIAQLVLSLPHNTFARMEHSVVSTCSKTLQSVPLVHLDSTVRQMGFPHQQAIVMLDFSVPRGLPSLPPLMD